jgi:hypothetical protein
MGKRVPSPLLQLSGRIPLSTIDLVISAELGPARVAGNAQPNVFFRQIAMYLAKHAGGWSTTRICRFYNGRDHSTVCYSIRKIEQARTREPQLDSLLSSLEQRCIEEAADSSHGKTANFSRHEGFEDRLNQLADRIAERILSRMETQGTREQNS